MYMEGNTLKRKDTDTQLLNRRGRGVIKMNLQYVNFPLPYAKT